MGAFGACQERPSQAFAYRKSRLPGYFCSPVFGLGCALFAAFFPAEKAAQGVRVLELVAALNSEVDFLNGGLLLADETVQNQQQQHLATGTVRRYGDVSSHDRRQPPGSRSLMNTSPFSEREHKAPELRELHHYGPASRDSSLTMRLPANK
jgi:hypothetical protein